MSTYLQGDIDFGFNVVLWDTSYLNDGTYELMLHVLCEPSGLSFPPPGIDEYYSSVVTGVCLVQR